MDSISRKDINDLTKFIAPIVFKNTICFEDISTENGFTIISTHLAILNYPEFDNYIILNIRNPIDHNLFIQGLLLRWLRENDSILLVFKVPNEHLMDLNLVVGGIYSKLSEKYKQQLLSFWKEDSNSNLYRVLNKNKSKRTNQLEKEPKELEYENSPEDYKKPLYSDLIFGI